MVRDHCWYRYKHQRSRLHHLGTTFCISILLFISALTKYLVVTFPAVLAVSLKVWACAVARRKTAVGANAST